MQTIRVVAAIIQRDGHYLITRRPDNVHLAGLWEFPGGKVEADESLEQALVREIEEELGVRVKVLEEYFQIGHRYPSRSVKLHFFDCVIVAGQPSPLHVAEMRWVAPEELENFTFPDADRALIARLRSRQPQSFRHEC